MNLIIEFVINYYLVMFILCVSERKCMYKFLGLEMLETNIVLLLKYVEYKGGECA